MSELRQLIALREVAKVHVKQWLEKAKAEAMDALFHEHELIRAEAKNRCWMQQGRHMEAEFWARQLQSAIDEELGPKSTTVEKESTAKAMTLSAEDGKKMFQSMRQRTLGKSTVSTTVDKQAEATAAAVVLGEEKQGYECMKCGTHYDHSEAHARKLMCCGCIIQVWR